MLLSQLDLGTVFSHPNAWFTRGTETVSPSPCSSALRFDATHWACRAEAQRRRGGLQTKIQLHFRFFKIVSNVGIRWLLAFSIRKSHTVPSSTVPETPDPAKPYAMVIRVTFSDLENALSDKICGFKPYRINGSVLDIDV